MVRHLGVTQATQAVAVKNCNEEYDAYISYKTLKEYYEHYLDKSIGLSDPQTPAEVHELGRIRTACVKSYLLYFVGCLMKKAINASTRLCGIRSRKAELPH